LHLFFDIGDTYLFGICTNYLSSSNFQDIPSKLNISWCLQPSHQSGSTKWETDAVAIICITLPTSHLPCVKYIGQVFLVRLWITNSKDCGSCGLFYMVFIDFLKWTNENHGQHMSELLASEQSSYLGSPKTNWLQCSVPPIWPMSVITNIAATAFLL
jgi:hypothetical protein